MLDAGISLGVIADAQIPDPGDPSIIAIAYVIGTVFDGALGSLIRGSSDAARDAGFGVAVALAGLALVTYLGLLIGDLA
jgi:hypothetical protein